MSMPQDWMIEARLRLEDALLLFNKGRHARSVSAAYYAFHAAGKGLLLTREIEIDSHPALRKQLSLHFVRGGLLPIIIFHDVLALSLICPHCFQAGASPTSPYAPCPEAFLPKLSRTASAAFPPRSRRRSCSPIFTLSSSSAYRHSRRHPSFPYKTIRICSRPSSKNEIGPSSEILMTSP